MTLTLLNILNDESKTDSNSNSKLRSTWRHYVFETVTLERLISATLAMPIVPN